MGKMPNYENSWVVEDALDKAKQAYRKLSDVETKVDAISTQISSPYNFKGEVSKIADLPTEASINDTYYVTGEGDTSGKPVNCKYTWNGSGWYQSSATVDDLPDSIESEINDVKEELKNTNARIIKESENIYINGYTEKVDGYLATKNSTSITTSTNYYTLKIRIKSNTTYTITHQRHWGGFFDSSGNKVGYMGGDGTDYYNYTVTSPNNAAYMWVVVPANENLSTFMVVEGEEMPADYIAGKIMLQDWIKINSTIQPIYNISSAKTVTYDVENRIISLPSGTVLFGTKAKAFNVQTINLSEVQTSDTCWVLSYNYDSGKINAEHWQHTFTYPTIGVAFKDKLFINGLLESQIELKNVPVSAPYNPTAYIGLRDDQYIIYNSATKELTLPPPGFSIVNNKGISRSQTGIINVSSILVSNACLFWHGENGIYATSWIGSKQTNMNDNLIGYIYRDNVVFFGVPQSQIIVKNDECCFFGDSITAGVNTTKCYHMYFPEWGCKTLSKNYGIGGTGYLKTYTGTGGATGGGIEGVGTAVEQNGNNTLIQVMQTVQTIKKCVLFAGTNDWNSSQPLDNFRTAVGNTLDYALSKTVYIMVITPIARTEYKTRTNNIGKTLADYSAVIKEECESRGIYCVDGFGVPLNPDNENYKTTFIPDGLHPNADGHKMVARKLYNDYLVAMNK